MNPVAALDLVMLQLSTKERPIEALRALVELRAFVDQAEAELVEICREPKWERSPESRFSLRQIADALGRSKSSVHRQYGDSWADAHAAIRALR